MNRITTFVLDHRRWVIGLWLVALLAGGYGASQVSNRLKVDFSLPGQPGYETAQKVIGLYGNGGNTEPSILLVHAPPGQTVTSAEAGIATAFDTLRREDPTVRVVDYASTHDARFNTRDGSATYALVFAPPPTSFSAALASKKAASILEHAAPPGAKVTSTGLAELASNGSSGGLGVLAETLIGALGALLILAFVFGSFLALLPLLIAAVSILTTLLITLGLTYVTDVSFIVQFLVSLVGLGVAIDYSLLIVTRWREERAHGRDNHEAVRIAMATAGQAVVFSGLTVGIGLVALVVLPVPGLRSVGIGGMLIPLVSVLVTSTLLPAILGGIGPRIDWPKRQRSAQPSKLWTAWTRGVVRHRWFAAGAAVAILAVLVIPVFSIKVGQTGPSALAKTGVAHDAYAQLVEGGVPSGVLTPIEVLTSTSSAPSVIARLKAVPGIETADVSSAADSNRNGTTVVIALPKQANLNTSSTATVTAARKALAGMPGVVGVTGIGAVQVDYVHAVFGNFPLMLSVIALLTFLLLARAFRSLLLPAKAVVFNLISLGATFGAITWFWQYGHGSSALFGISATGAITFWVPLMIFAFLFGLSMDYEVFILSRVREEYDRSGDTDEAVIEGLGRTGRLVTSAALILFLAFAALASAPNTDIKVLATALGFGILLDATVVRALLLPALVSLFGDWNWAMPRWAARALLIPAAPESSTSTATSAVPVTSSE